jgi:hypothetical protein
MTAPLQDTHKRVWIIIRMDDADGADLFSNAFGVVVFDFMPSINVLYIVGPGHQMQNLSN